MSKTFKLLEDTPDSKAEKVGSDFKLAGQNATDGVLQEMWSIYQARVGNDQYAALESLNFRINEVNGLAAAQAP